MTQLTVRQMMSDIFLELLKKKRKTVVYCDKNGETVAFEKTEEQPHPIEVRLFERLDVYDRIMVEATLSARRECSFPVRSAEGDILQCVFQNMQGNFFAVMAKENGEAEKSDMFTEFLNLCELCDAESMDSGLCQGWDALAKITDSLADVYPDLKLNFANKMPSTEVLDMHLSNLIRICMLCADAANTVSRSRELEIKLKRNSDLTEIMFTTDAEGLVEDDERLRLASFIAKVERGDLYIKTEKGRLKIDFFFPAEPGAMPDFKYRDQFRLYGEYFGKVRSEIAALHAKQKGKH